jgi:capsular polysaccharide biosynthesis protein
MTGQWRAEEPGTEVGWSDDDELYGTDERSEGYPPDRLVTLRFLRDAVRRHALLWIGVALIGLAAGTAVPFVAPPARESSAKLLLTHREGENPEAAMATDASLVTTRTVAELAIKRLNLTDSPDELLKRYSATAQTDRVLQIDTKAPTSAEATALAGALADVYLSFRKAQVAAQEKPLQADLTVAKGSVRRAEAALRAAGGDPNDPSAPASVQLTRLNQAKETQRYIEQQILDQQVAASRMSSSRLLDEAAPVPQSARHTQMVSSGSGLIAGLFLGIGFVIVRAMISERLWRRQDVAHALGAPVRLSVGRPRRRWLRPSIRLLRRPEPNLRPVIRHLGMTTDSDDALKPALAVVSVDNTDECALVIASLAVALAGHDRRVLVADLTDTGDLAATFGVKKPGTYEAQVKGAALPLNVYRPVSGTGALEGRHLQDWDAGSPDDRALHAVWVASDVVLTLATLTPALGADHLRAWSSRVAVVVTAGRSTVTKLHATGEMIRLAGLRLESAVLIGSDRRDDSLGQWDDEAGQAPESTGFGVVAP